MARRHKTLLTTPTDAGIYKLEVVSLKVLDDTIVPGAMLKEDEDLVLESYLLNLRVVGKRGLQVKALLRFNLDAFLGERGDRKSSMKDFQNAITGYDRKLDALDDAIGLDDGVDPGQYMASVVGKKFQAEIEPQKQGFVRLVFIGQRPDADVS